MVLIDDNKKRNNQMKKIELTWTIKKIGIRKAKE